MVVVRRCTGTLRNVAASLAIKDYVWIKGLLEECKISYSEECFIYIDNHSDNSVRKRIEQLQE